MDINSFAWLVPLAFTSFAGVFFALRLNGIGSHWWWGTFLLAASAFVVSMIPTSPLAIAKPVLEDTLFLAAFAAYALGTAQRAGARPRYGLIGACVAGGAVGAALALALTGSVRLELAAVHTGCALILLEAARMLCGRLRHVPDRALLVLNIAIAINLVAQSLALALVGDAPLTVDMWWGSAPAYLLQASGATMGILFALALLLAIGRDIIDTLRQASECDPLTGVFNRRGFERRSQELLAEISEGAKGCILLVDIDHFKKVNDEYGHSAGDAVISAFAALLETLSGEKGSVGRLGGEEFSVFLAAADLDRARDVAEAMRVSFAEMAWPAPMKEAQLTASFGLTDLAASETLAEATIRADKMLYFAKRNGRNRVCWCSSQSLILPPDPNGIGHPGERLRSARDAAAA